MKIRTILSVLSFFTATFTAFAHVDRIITLERGVLVGLPDQYMPAAFSVVEQKLTIGRHTVTLPKCISSYWGSIESSNITFSSSWYHKRSSLPPYLVLRIRTPDSKDQFHLLLNLETLAIIYLQRVIVEGAVTKFEDVPVSSECLAEWKVTENEK